MCSNISKSSGNGKPVFLRGESSADPGLLTQKGKGPLHATSCVRFAAAVKERCPIKTIRFLIETLYASVLHQEGMNSPQGIQSVGKAAMGNSVQALVRLYRERGWHKLAGNPLVLVGSTYRAAQGG